MAARGSLDRERALYELGPRLLEDGGVLPPLSSIETAHVLRGLWDRAGFIGPNNGGYPVVSLLAPEDLARSIAAVIEAVTGSRTLARPVGDAYWVGVSGWRCRPLLAYLYGGARIASEAKRRRAAQLYLT